mmetsp:Transcript_74469/g.241797  ORF Transcript_74469/g.241797 Transcript_74469/m.241797 type:complete len:331 (-) Transcript_74469:210-1202(-)
MPAIVPAMCVNLNSGLWMTSPTAKMSGFEVERSSFTFTPMPGVNSTPATSRPKPSTFGARPVATKKASQTTTSGSAASPRRTVILISGQGSPAVKSTRSTLRPTMSFTPACSSTWWITAAASGSSGPMMRFMPSSTVTWEPKRLKACDNSTPMGPAPITARRGGARSKLKMFALVRYGASARPGIGGTLARAPVQITAFLKRSVCSPTLISLRPMKTPRPTKASAPAAVVLLWESTGAIWALRRRMRSMTLAKSASASSRGRLTPPNKSACARSAAARAQRSRAFEGTQPTLRQSPPARCSSMSALFAPRRADCLAATRPPAPAPMATRS